MKKNFQEQFQNLGNIIQANVVTLKSLITQSEQLSDIACKLGDEPTTAELKISLEAIKTSISESIKALVEQTQKLFKTYDKLIDEVLGK